MTVMLAGNWYAEVEDLRSRARRKLDYQAARALRYQRYYDGDHDILALMNTEERRAFRDFLRESGANWCELVINAVAERLQVTGFRFAGDEAEDAWGIWQASHMDADAELVQTDALVTGSGFMLVQPDDDNPTGVSITPESPFEATVLYEPGNRRVREAGFKRYRDEWETDGSWTEVLILPDQVITWEPGAPDPEVEANPAGEVGMVEIVPQPRLGRPPRSEMNSCLVIQDRINTTIFSRLVSTDYGAFRQMWATGLKLARKVIKDAKGEESVKPVRPFDMGVNRLLVNENPEGRFGAFPEASLRGYLDSIEQDVKQLAAITQTPAHYLLGEMVNLSADAIKAAEAGLVAKVGRRALHIGEGHEEVMRTALRMLGHPAAADTSAEVLWRDFETRSEGQRVDALVKMRTLGVPLEVLWERWGASPQEIERWRRLAEAEAATGPEAAYAQLLAAAAPPPAST